MKIAALSLMVLLILYFIVRPLVYGVIIAAEIALEIGGTILLGVFILITILLPFIVLPVCYFLFWFFWKNDKEAELSHEHDELVLWQNRDEKYKKASNLKEFYRYRKYLKKHGKPPENSEEHYLWANRLPPYDK